MKRCAIIADLIYRAHETGPCHPECPNRYDAALRGVELAADNTDLVYIKPAPASREQLKLCHTEEYIETVIRDVRSGSYYLSTGEVDLCSESFDVALHAAGGAIAAADAVMNGSSDRAFCILRPPGHHASQDTGTGFCIFNNIAILTRYLQSQYGLERILIIDWDVHHGNGTQDIFYDDPSVLYFSTHQWPLFPGTGITRQTGAGRGEGFTINCPMPAGTGRHEIFAAFNERLIPAVKKFRPEAVLISAGFDSHFNDPIGNFMLNTQDFSDLTSICCAIADEYSDGRLISCLEGGYNLSTLTETVAAHVTALSE